MPRITRRSSAQEDVVDISSPTQEDDKSQLKLTLASNNKVHPQTPQSQCVMIVPNVMLENQQNKFVVVTLRNPKTASGTLYAFSHSNTKVYEINQFEEPKRSWFLDNSVQANGSFFLTTIIDPLFLILPYLYKAKHASPLDQLLADEDYFETFKLSSCCKTEDIEKIADCKQSEHFQAWKYNEEKTLKWLEKKILRLSNHLKEKNYNVMNLAVSSNYVKSNSTSTIPENAYTRYAFGIISEYLSDEISAALETHLDLPAIPKSVATDEGKEPPSKRQKLGSVNHEPIEDYSKDQNLLQAKDKTPVSAKSKAFANAAKGSKSIASFFGKKS